MLQVGEVYSEMLRHAERSVVLADHSKFGKRALMLLSGWTRHMTLVTDRAPDPELKRAVREAGAEIILPNKL
jgi:DeoR/GlpR family transcriptional regulator of sugar metabolism